MVSRFITAGVQDDTEEIKIGSSGPAVWVHFTTSI